MNETKTTEEKAASNPMKARLEVVSALIGIGSTALALLAQFIGFFDKYERAAEILLFIGVISLTFYFGNYARKRQGKGRLVGITVIILVAVVAYFIWVNYIQIPGDARKEIDSGDVALSYGMPETALEHYRKALDLAPGRRVIINKVNEAKLALDQQQEDLIKRQQGNK